MDINSRIHIGYVYELHNGLLRYEGAWASFPDKNECIMVHRFTVVKPIYKITRKREPWEEYIASGGNVSEQGSCIYFRREAFQYMEYNPTLTVLCGK